ncbi:MAG: RNA polymerase sigma factor [Candidatus Izimaplasma sp.]|nr:RNA polymerase sigma factor [Candidatus Izimaplasma bacterium]
MNDKQTNEDNKIIAHILDGKKDHFSVLMDKYHNEIFKYVYNLVYDYETTEDLLQEIFFKVFKNIDKFDSEKASFRTWLYRIANYHTMNYFNSKKYKHQTKESAYIKDTFESGDNVEEAAIKEERISQIVKQIRTLLKPKHQKIMFLHFFSGLTVKEISETTGIPDKTIYKAVKSSIKKIKKEVEINEEL